MTKLHIVACRNVEGIQLLHLCRTKSAPACHGLKSIYAMPQHKLVVGHRPAPTHLYVTQNATVRRTNGDGTFDSRYGVHDAEHAGNTYQRASWKSQAPTGGPGMVKERPLFQESRQLERLHAQHKPASLDARNEEFIIAYMISGLGATETSI